MALRSPRPPDVPPEVEVWKDGKSASVGSGLDKESSLVAEMMTLAETHQKGLCVDGRKWIGYFPSG